MHHIVTIIFVGISGIALAIPVMHYNKLTGEQGNKSFLTKDKLY